MVVMGRRPSTTVALGARLCSIQEFCLHFHSRQTDTSFVLCVFKHIPVRGQKVDGGGSGRRHFCCPQGTDAVFLLIPLSI